MPPRIALVGHVKRQLAKPFALPSLWIVDAVDLGHDQGTGGVTGDGSIAAAVV